MIKKEKDHIWPRSKGGPDKPWNIREIPWKDNRDKKDRMPYPFEVLESSDPIKLAVELDKYLIKHKRYKGASNRSRGFGGVR